MLDDGDGLSSEDGLVDPERGRHDGDQADVGRGLVTDWTNKNWLKKNQRFPSCVVPRTRDLDDVSGHQLVGPDVLHADLVRPDDLAHLGLVLLQGLDGVLGVALLNEA